MEMLSGTRPDKDEGSMRLSIGWSYGTYPSVVERVLCLFKHMVVWGLLLIAAEPGFAQSSVAAGSAPLKMVVLGDSLSAGYGLAGAEAFPAKLQKALKAKGIEVDMTNAGVSGDTSSGGGDRLDWAVAEGTQAEIGGLGAKDGLRGTDPAVTRSALTDIVTRLKARGIAVMLCGMLAPPNYGADFAARFNTIYPDIAKLSGCAFFPFFPGGRRARSQAQPGRWLASNRGRS